ncbi:hypothetical protein [Planococcus shenhongbingii]|uniref:Antitoxin n=1 Tax=Planococcus shenhongbingii TaxID=3058398 RepID=A0ABT8N9X7_9BACL|nr:hypothetical protein [Planococcus sp. N017]MDN7244656.1 hypothetical protein [Planococcus sp. N017]
MAFIDKLNELKDKSIEKGKAHWDENKDGYIEKATNLKNTIKDKVSK